MEWFFLILAGILEVGWAISLKNTDGWRNLPYLLITVIFGLAAAYALSRSMKFLPVGVAYPVWKGLAIIGIFCWELFVGKEIFHWTRFLFIVLILSGIIGLNVTSNNS